MIKAIEQLNCNTTSILQGRVADFTDIHVTFQHRNGVKRRKIKRQSAPGGENAVTITQASAITQKKILEKGISISLLVSALKDGNASCTNNTDSANAIKVIRIDSIRN